jgi:hypothetical protein
MVGAVFDPAELVAGNRDLLNMHHPDPDVSIMKV